MAGIARAAMADGASPFLSACASRKGIDSIEARDIAEGEDAGDEVERTQHAADVSLVFFEHMARFWSFDPAQFALGVMTRSKDVDLSQIYGESFVENRDGRISIEPAGS